MDFQAIQDQLVAGSSPRFAEAQRAEAKLWINDRYAELWGLEQWTFRDGTDQVTVTAASASVTGITADVGIITGFWRDDGERLQYLEPRNFYDLYYGDTSPGTPEHYTFINGALSVGPKPNVSSTTYQLLYQKKLTLLVEDDDVPLIPVEHHFLLVHGAMATGQVMTQDFTYQFADQRWINGIASMRRNYLVNVRGDSGQYGADPIEDGQRSSDGW